MEASLKGPYSAQGCLTQPLSTQGCQAQPLSAQGLQAQPLTDDSEEAQRNIDLCNSVLADLFQPETPDQVEGEIQQGAFGVPHADGMLFTSCKL